MKPLLSVSMSTFQHRPFIAQAINGVLMQQTDFPVQLVIGEDSSTDGTRSVCEKMAKAHHEKVLLLPSDRNYGQNHNLFRTIRACEGKYIALCEGDDYWTAPYKLQKQVDFLEKNPAYAFCFHQVNIVNEDGTLVEERKEKDAHLYSWQEVFHISVPTLSIVFRNCLSEFPEEFFQMKSTDAFIIAMLTGFGGGADLGFVGGCYRKHNGGLYNQLKLIKKCQQTIHSRKFMYRSPFFNREQKEEIGKELRRREILYIKMFLKKGKFIGCIRLLFFYWSF